MTQPEGSSDLIWKFSKSDNFNNYQHFSVYRRAITDNCLASYSRASCQVARRIETNIPVIPNNGDDAGPISDLRDPIIPKATNRVYRDKDPGPSLAASSCVPFHGTAVHSDHENVVAQSSAEPSVADGQTILHHHSPGLPSS